MPLRELALLWVADRVEESLQEYRERHGISAPWETRERVAVALTGAPGSENLIRRAARIAGRAKTELVGIHVRGDDGLAGSATDAPARHRRLLEELGGTYRDVVGSDVAKTLAQAARAEGATQLVLGASRRSRWVELTRGSIIGGIIRESGRALDVHVISTGDDAAVGSTPSPGVDLQAERRRLWLRGSPSSSSPPARSSTPALRRSLSLRSCGWRLGSKVHIRIRVGGGASGSAPEEPDGKLLTRTRWYDIFHLPKTSGGQGSWTSVSRGRTC